MKTLDKNLIWGGVFKVLVYFSCFRVFKYNG